MNNYYLKIADIKIHVKSPFKINIGVESKDFISKYEDEDILLEYIEIKEPLKIDGTLVYDNTVKFYKTKMDLYMNYTLDLIWKHMHGLNP